MFCFRRYKTQLRDFLSSCRTKRTKAPADIYPESSGFPPGYPATAATAYMSAGNLSYPAVATDTTTLYMQQANIAAAPAAYQSLYPGVDNRWAD